MRVEEEAGREIVIIQAIAVTTVKEVHRRIQGLLLIEMEIEDMEVEAAAMIAEIITILSKTLCTQRSNLKISQ